MLEKVWLLKWKPLGIQEKQFCVFKGGMDLSSVNLVFVASSASSASSPAAFASRNASRSRNRASSSFAARALAGASTRTAPLPEAVSAVGEEGAVDDVDVTVASSSTVALGSGTTSGTRYRASAERGFVGSSSARPNHVASVSSKFSSASSHVGSGLGGSGSGAPPNAASYAGLPSPEGR